MDKKDVQELSMKIIGLAGDAFSYYFQALDEAKKNNPEKSDELLKKGDDSLNKAHKMQTEMIVSEAKGEQSEYSILMVHAQDHLMNAILVKKLVKEFMEIYKKLEGCGKND